MASFASSFGYNFSGQLVARVISFGINMYLLRVVDRSILGLVNVRLTLLYQTVLFLTREPFRKANNLLGDSLPKFVNVLWLSPLVCAVVSTVCGLLWATFSPSSSSLECPLWAIAAFLVSALLEGLAEPFAIVSLRFSLNRHFAFAQSLLVFLQRAIVFALIFVLRIDHLTLFCGAQIAASTVYLLFYVVSFWRLTARRASELKPFFDRGGEGLAVVLPRQGDGVDPEAVKSVKTLFGHSILKQLLTDGSAYVMTFTNMLTLEQQAVYEAIERIGSLVARVLLAPMEDACFTYFSTQLNKNSKDLGIATDSRENVIYTLKAVLHMTVVVGSVVVAFGIPYSKIAVWIYGGRLLYDNGGALLLSLYSAYVLVIAVNGITECFAFATMNRDQVFSHGSFLFVSAVVHLALNLVLCYEFSAAGFIIANILNMAVRIGYSWRHISRFLGSQRPSPWEFLPTPATAGFLVFCLLVTSFSQLLFASTPGFVHSATHVAVGVVLLGFFAGFLVKEDIYVNAYLTNILRLN